MAFMIARRSLLRGLFAAPAIVAAASLMPIRGISLSQLLPDPYGNLSDAELVALLEQRLEQSVGHWDDVNKRWVLGKDYGATEAEYVRFGGHQTLRLKCLGEA